MFREETCFLVKCNRRVRPPLCSDAVFRVPLDMLHGNLALSGVDAYSVSFRICPELWGSSQVSVGETGLLLRCEDKFERRASPIFSR